MRNSLTTLTRCLAEYLDGADAAAILEPIIRVRVPEADASEVAPQTALPEFYMAGIEAREPQRRLVVLEGAFARYMELWAVLPTLDVTGHALHTLRAFEQLDPWLSENGQQVLASVLASETISSRSIPRPIS